jgi:putative hydrolase of the HAD superfamily
MRIRSIFFDLDNTLLDRDAAWKTYWSKFIQQQPEIFGPDMQAVLERIIHEDQHGWTNRPALFSWMVESFPKLNRSPKELWEQCGKELGKLAAPYPGATELLASLKTVYSLVLVTNGNSSVQRMKLLNSGFSSYFDHVFVSGEVGHDKPDPRIFAAALKSANYPPNQILFVGDDPVKDIWGAANAGMKTCWISHGNKWTGKQPKPDYVISKASELPSILQTSVDSKSCTI